MTHRVLTAVSFCMTVFCGVILGNGAAAHDIECMKLNLEKNPVKHNVCVEWDPELVSTSFSEYNRGAWTGEEVKDLDLVLARTKAKLLEMKQFSFAQAGAECKEQCANKLKKSSNGMTCDDFCTGVLNNFITNAANVGNVNVSSFHHGQSFNYYYSMDNKYRAESLPCAPYANIDVYSVGGREFCPTGALDAILDGNEGLACYKIYEKNQHGRDYIALMFVGKKQVAYTDPGGADDGNFALITGASENTSLCLKNGYHGMRFWLSKSGDGGRLEYSNPYEKNVSDLKTEYIPEIERLQKSLTPTMDLGGIFAGDSITKITHAYNIAGDWLKSARDQIAYGYKQDVHYSVQKYAEIRKDLDTAIALQPGVLCAFNKLKSMGAGVKNAPTIANASPITAQDMAQRMISDAIHECDKTVTLQSLNCNGPVCAAPGAGRVNCSVGGIAISYSFDDLCK